ncbi:hypothetical protein QZH41_018804 [Actinostola sp. cb2023]|nr:hypothetical protein QZH41_018804 [Actinostola sp. cb2023]
MDLMSLFRSRLENLARPKPSKAAWVTKYWPVDWTNQTLIRPISKPALSAKTTPRLQELATPKNNVQMDHPELCHR